VTALLSDLPPVTRDLTPLFDPSSVAIVGASDDPGKYGNWLAVRALRGRRPVHLVNRSRPTVLGRPAVPSIAGLDLAVDLAVIAVPAAAFEAAVDDALEAGVKAIVGITAGLGETGGEGRRRQEALAARVQAAGACLLGPNCLGVLDHTSKLDLTVNDFPVGDIAVLSQSGNIAIDLAAQMTTHGLGVSRFASIGNQADLDVADLIESCVEHDGTRAIALYCEGFRDGRRFVSAALRAHQAGKPVVLLTVGRGTASARGAASHTGSLVSSDVVVQAACEAAGAENVSSPSQLADLLQAMVRTRPPTGKRVAVFSDGGGHASLASDCLEAVGMRVEEFPEALRKAVATELPPNATVANPIDVAGAGEQDITCFTRVAGHLVASRDIDAVVMTGYFGGFRDYSDELAVGEVQAARDIARAVAERGATYVSHTMFPQSPAAQALREGGIAVYRNVETAAWALSRLGQWAAREPHGVPQPHPAANAVTQAGYWSARMLLADAGVPFVAAAEVATREELRIAATALGFPLVLKALGDEHKSDRGGVVLGIRDQEHLERAWNDLQDRLAPPTVSVEQMADLTDGVELIVGVRQDPSFGPIVLVGIGGVYTELLRDTRCALGPLDPESARALLLSLKGAALLTGYRGKPAVDIDAAARLVSTVSHFAAAHTEISEVECNPVAVTPRGVTALDARIILAR